jgi:hypothetical protein
LRILEKSRQPEAARDVHIDEAGAMVVRFETRQARQLRLDAARQRKYVERFRLCYEYWGAGDVSLADLCAEAGDALDGYAAETIQALCRAGIDRHERTGWIADQYYAGISSVGTAIRDETADSAARHAVAQTLQERLLRAEMRLRGGDNIRSVRPDAASVL